MSAPSICNPWKELPVDAPFVLAEDRSLVEQFNARVDEEYRLHVELLPDPFIGNPAAPIVLLNLNPGFKEDDLDAHRDPYFIRACRNNLLHTQSEYPFYYLDPCLRSPGCHWWEGKLKQLLLAAPRQRVAQSLFCVELFPYHSEQFKEMRTPLPSREYSLELVRAAMRRDVLVVVMRSLEPWFVAVPELMNYPNRCVLSVPRNPVITENTCTAFETIRTMLAK